MKVLVINCSPVRNGATAEIVKIVTDCLKKRPGYQPIEFIEWARKYDTGSVNMRSKEKHDEWQKLLMCKQIVLNGADDLEENFKKAQAEMKFVIGRTVTVTVERPLGSYHPEHNEMYYPINLCTLRSLQICILLDKQYRGLISEYSEKKKEIYLLQGNKSAYMEQLRQLVLEHEAGDLDFKACGTDSC